MLSSVLFVSVALKFLKSITGAEEKCRKMAVKQVDGLRYFSADACHPNVLRVFLNTFSIHGTFKAEVEPKLCPAVATAHASCDAANRNKHPTRRRIWGKCSTAVMMQPNIAEQFVVPALRRQKTNVKGKRQKANEIEDRSQTQKKRKRAASLNDKPDNHEVKHKHKASLLAGQAEDICSHERH